MPKRHNIETSQTSSFAMRIMPSKRKRPGPVAGRSAAPKRSGKCAAHATPFGIAPKRLGFGSGP
jgi:hypothetical protein